MSSIGTGYDLSASTYSPDGRIFQVEYASKAVDNSGTTVGLRVKDGVVLATEKLVTSKLLLNNRRIQSAASHIGIVHITNQQFLPYAFSGLLADGRHFINRAKEEAYSYNDTYRTPIPAHILADRLGQFAQAYTLYSSVRPFGITALVAVGDSYKGPQLYVIEPSGVYYGYNGTAVGKGRQVAKTEIEKLDLKNMTAREAIKHAAKIIAMAHDESKDREYELELSWISQETGYKHQLVTGDLLEDAKKFATEALTDVEMQE